MLYMRHTSTLLYNMDIRDGATPVSVVILMIDTRPLIGLLIGNTSSIVIAFRRVLRSKSLFILY